MKRQFFSFVSSQIPPFSLAAVFIGRFPVLFIIMTVHELL